MKIRKTNLDSSLPEKDRDSHSDKIEKNLKRPLIRRIGGKSHAKQMEEASKPNYSFSKSANIDSLALQTDISLTDLVEKTEKILPLPRERQMNISQTHRNWLIAQLHKNDSENELINFAYSLNHDQLSFIFPILATISKRSHKEKIKTIISLRASKILYAQGWITLQYIYPDNQLAKVLTNLCEKLENKKIPLALRKKENENNLNANLFPYPHINWSKIKLITKISNPDNRRFINHLVKHLLDKEIEIENFFKEYGIYDDLSLGIAIKNNYETEKLERNFSKIQNVNLSWRDLLGLDDKD